MYGITKKTILLFLQETPAHKYLIVSDGWGLEGGGKGEFRGGLLFAVSVLPPSFNSPNDLCSHPAVLFLGLDQRIQ